MQFFDVNELKPIMVVVETAITAKATKIFFFIFLHPKSVSGTTFKINSFINVRMKNDVHNFCANKSNAKILLLATNKISQPRTFRFVYHHFDFVRQNYELFFNIFS